MPKKRTKMAYLKTIEGSLNKAKSNSQALSMMFERVNPELSIKFEWLVEQIGDLLSELAQFKQGV